MRSSDFARSVIVIDFLIELTEHFAVMSATQSLAKYLDSYKRKPEPLRPGEISDFELGQMRAHERLARWHTVA